MKILVGVAAGAVLTVNGIFLVGMAKMAYEPPCQYILETPSANESYWSLQDARNAMSALGVDPSNTPEGWDIVSRKGC